VVTSGMVDCYLELSREFHTPERYPLSFRSREWGCNPGAGGRGMWDLWRTEWRQEMFPAFSHRQFHIWVIAGPFVAPVSSDQLSHSLTNNCLPNDIFLTAEIDSREIATWLLATRNVSFGRSIQWPVLRLYLGIYMGILIWSRRLRLTTVGDPPR
jgi:hypothetical protein